MICANGKHVSGIKLISIFLTIRPNCEPTGLCTWYLNSHDVTAAILVSQNNERAAMLVFQTNPVGVELFFYAKAFSFSNKFA